MSLLQPPPLGGIPPGVFRFDVVFEFWRPDQQRFTHGFIRVDLPHDASPADVRREVERFVNDISALYGWDIIPEYRNAEIMAVAAGVL